MGRTPGRHVLTSLIKDLIGRRRADKAPADPVLYHDVDELVQEIRAKSQAFAAHGYLDYPVFVHLETLAVCNAACGFCPYPVLERKGTKMPDKLIEKVIDDLTEIPPHVPFRLAPYKLSEPFIEPRLFDIIDLATTRLPGMEVCLITNGSALTDRQVGQLLKARRIAYLHVSLNFDNAEEYESVMQLSFDRTLARLDALHARKARDGIPFPVRITRVASERTSDAAFVRWVQARYPAFPVMILPRNDWIGEVVTEGALAQVPDAPCHRWFDLSITATGIVAMCCMDGEARYPTGDVNTEHALAIYNRPGLRELRRSLVSRRESGAPCNRCTYLSG